MDEELEESEVSLVNEEIIRQRTEEFVKSSCEHLAQNDFVPQVNKLVNISCDEPELSPRNQDTTLNPRAPANSSPKYHM